MLYGVDTTILFVFKELGNTISSLFGGGSAEPSANVTEPVQVKFNIKIFMQQIRLHLS